MSAIDDKWAALGGPGGFLGWPQDEGAGSEEMDTNPPGGRCRDFQGGSIYFKPGVGAFEVHGDIRLAWVRWRAEGGVLGFPTTDESGTPDGRGRYNHFERGSIYWTPQTGAHVIYGDIRQRWAEMGWERSRLGYPTSDERDAPMPGGRMNDFEGGVIFWTPPHDLDVRFRID